MIDEDMNFGYQYALHVVAYTYPLCPEISDLIFLIFLFTSMFGWFQKSSTQYSFLFKNECESGHLLQSIFRFYAKVGFVPATWSPVDGTSRPSSE